MEKIFFNLQDLISKLLATFELQKLINVIVQVFVPALTWLRQLSCTVHLTTEMKSNICDYFNKCVCVLTVLAD